MRLAATRKWPVCENVSRHARGVFLKIGVKSRKWEENGNGEQAGRGRREEREKGATKDVSNISFDIIFPPSVTKFALICINLHCVKSHFRSAKKI